MKSTWRGTVTSRDEQRDLTDWSGAVHAETPADAVERAVRLAFSGQPRRAERAQQVTVSLRKDVV